MRDGYDRISYEYRDDSGGAPSVAPSGQPGSRPDYEAWLEELTPRLRDGDPVLDLGCGCGLPTTAILAERYQVVGVDVSTVQIQRARRLVPKARFRRGDMATVQFPAQRFRAIVSFYAIIHVPVDEQPQIFRRIHRWLKPDGYLLATVGTKAWTGTEVDWHGAPMYWSHADQATYLRWLEALNFEILWTRFIPEGAGGHTLLLARRSAQ